MHTSKNPEAIIPDSYISLDNIRDSEIRKQLSPSGFRLFVNFCNRWGFDEKQRLALLGDIHRQTYQKWKREGVNSLSRDQLERISLVLGIHKGLRLLFADHDSAKRWFFSKNHDLPFCGISPSDYLLKGTINNLYAVRRYIDAWRGMK